MSRSLGVRGIAALVVARIAGWASRVSGRGSGGVIGGNIAHRIDPHLLDKLGSGLRPILVTGTNGKSSTNKMVRAALSTLNGANAVASNTNGDNMMSGALVALINNPKATYAALEVDEMYLVHLAGHVHPEVIVLLNLSRDQLDRVGEISKVEASIRRAISENPQATVIANCDDPLIVSAAWDAHRVVWVACGSTWKLDSVSFPRTGSPIYYSGLGADGAEKWWVEGHPEYSRPDPTWSFRGETGSVSDPAILHTPFGETPINLALPGRVNLGNAALALAAVTELGVQHTDALRAVENVTSVAGRYGRLDLGAGRCARILLAKNPAGWQEALNMVPDSANSVVLVTNGRVADGHDLSWLYDVDFTVLNPDLERPILVAGQRARDLQVRLRYAGFPNPLLPGTSGFGTMMNAPGPEIVVLANYTAFADLQAVLRSRNMRLENE